MKRIILIILLIIQISLVNAIGPVGENGLDIKVINNSIEIRGYTIVAAPPYGVPTKFVSSNPLFINILSESLGGTEFCSTYNYTSGNQTISTNVNCSYLVNYVKELPFIANFTNQTITTITDVNTQNKYDQCVLEKAQYSTSYNNCLNSKNLMINYETNYTNCKEQLNSCQNQLTTCQGQVTIMTKEKEDTKNTPWIYGAIGLAIGIVGALFYTGKIGGQKAKNYEDNFQRGQAA